ncbi:MAG TPA: methyltransferase [Chitinophagaceae bacterium]|jgi:hypothetical protein|nr:methyltransferase [Chitinophagaceae bacterium]
METVKRRSFQGVFNIIRFNRHYYLLMGLILVGMYYFMNHSPAGFHRIWKFIMLLGLGTVILSLVVSYFIYDYSSFYSLDWTKVLQIQPGMRIANIHAGFDETSEIMVSKFPGTAFFVYDFYDPEKHTELSIKRARQAYPPFPGTVRIQTTDQVLPEKNLDYIFLIFAAHEIRDASERRAFFRTLRGGLNKDGRILVVEHTRDIINFLAFSIGFLHFFSFHSWLRVFTNASLRLESKKKINPFVTLYILTPS